MARFICNCCGFSAERENSANCCPYCSKKNSLEEEENAEELVGEDV